MPLITKNRVSHTQETVFDVDRFNRFFDEIVADAGRDFDEAKLTRIKNDVIEYVNSRDKVPADRLFDLIIRSSNDQISATEPDFTYLSAATLRRKLYKQASRNRGYNYKNKYGDYFSFVVQMVESGIYDSSLLDAYTEKELVKAGKLISAEMDKKFSYAGLYLLFNTYLKKGYDGAILELPQERFLTTALYLMRDEKKSKRMEYVKEAYWALSNHYVGLATPTLLSGGAPHGTLSSCHIITLDDDLVSIMNGVIQAARFSQNGAGIGTYLGFLRSSGSWIRGYKGRASGVLHPSRLHSVLAEYVNQLGSRVAGIALYLPVWHADIFDFLDLRLKTGSQETRAHSIKTAVTLPDEFMRRLEAKKNFTIFDPYEFRQKMGVDLNKLYDREMLREGETPNEEDHAFTYWYRKAEQDGTFELAKVVSATDIYRAIFTSRKTSGTPYLYYHDTSARLNPNGHMGMPYGSNLCCVTGDQLAVTSEGMRRVKDLYEDGTSLNLFDGTKTVTADPMQLIEKDAQVYKITTTDGREHRVTDYHKVKTPEGMVEARDLEVGDRVAIQLNEGLFGDTHDPDMAFLLGLYQSDGTQSDVNIYIDLYDGKTMNVKGEVERAVTRVYAAQGWNEEGQGSYQLPSFYRQVPTEGGVAKARLQSAKLKQFGFTKGAVPEWIWSATKETQSRYLQGLYFGDGSYSESGGIISLTYTSTDKTFLGELQVMLANLGVTARLYDLHPARKTVMPDGKGGRKEYDCNAVYRLVITNRADATAFEELTGFIKWKGKALPEAKRRTYKRKEFVEVASIEEDGVEDVYCTHVHSEEHVWVCNGFITSNSEIIQNMSYDEVQSEELDERGFLYTKTLSGDLVTCNLSSLVVNNVFDKEQDVDLQRVVDIQFRMLDNVISLNRTVVPQATYTNQQYRAVGAGAMGLVTHMTSNGIKWESDAAAEFTADIFKQYLKAMIKASAALAEEKGSYPLFEGSDWHTGEFFAKRGFLSDEWAEYRELASKGMRNAYLSAIAPTSSNSLIMNASPSIDPPYAVVYKEDKSGLNVIVVPPNYNNATKWFYKSGFEMDEMWAINVIAAAQKYIDQGISHNMHVSKEIKGSEMLRLDIGAWKKGLKTIYYTYTENFTLGDDCIMCES